MSWTFKLTTTGLLILFLAACGTAQPAEVATEAAGGAGGEQGGEATEAVTEEATEAPTGGATVSVSTNMNCRSGPGSNFDLVYLMKAGESADILGTNASGQYWVIDSPNGECWLWNADAVTSGDTSGLTAYTSPPTPTPVPPPDWNGTWHVWLGLDSSGNLQDFTIGFTQTGEDFYCEIRIGMTAIKLYGTVSDDGMYITGTIPASGGRIPFHFHRNPDDLRQFSGIWQLETFPGMDLDFCGSKGGAPQPVPCRYH